MAASHHGQESGELKKLIDRFHDQIAGTARREYPAGRMGAEDDGVLTLAMTTDVRHSTIMIRFGKPVEWIGLGIAEAEYLRDQLTERLMDLRGITAT